MKLYAITTGTNVSTNNNIYRIYVNPTVSDNGTPLTPVCLNINGENRASAMQLFTVPTVSANGTRMMNIIQGATSMDVIAFPYVAILHSGQKLLITVRPNTTGVTYSMNFFWIEED
jgi:hypothetical protein